ncbi:nek2 [Musca autumnalis]|uniref:nek2 n=1 Tax=Musca autumnalis TaxID=221902 RepID=UPI003CF6383B
MVATRSTAIQNVRVNVNKMSVERMKTSSSSSAHDMDISAQFARKTLQDYEVISVIGNGAFGTCFKVRDKETGELFAWKGMDYDELSESQKESLISEIRVLRQLQHPNIVQYYHHLVNHEAKSIFIVMECCEGGDLSQLIAKAKAENKRFEERYIWRVLFQLCRALQVCHNKIKDGTILHRDIKPANIFLDMEGNVKLGDFGLARMLKRNESFAETFVGTPYYMSPEMVKGSKYDRKSDVWAVGCLIYEMCALRPPFKGKEFTQLSANISNGKFNKIPEIYSKDLQEIIAFMLEVEYEQRPSIEVISRHPILVRNINELGNQFPRLVDIESVEQDFYVTTSDEPEARCKLEYSPLHPLHDFSSTVYSEQNSFHEGYGQRRLSITGVFTPDLRAELFYSAKRRIFPINPKLQLSDPELYETIRREEYATIDETIKPKYFSQEEEEVELSPDVLTRDIFDGVLQERLHAIRAQESLLRQREEALNSREQQLNEKEKRLIAFEQSLMAKFKSFNEEQQQAAKSNSNSRPSSVNERSRISLPDMRPASEVPPPIPPRKPVNPDETYCTIEPTDTTLLHEPTVAKLNLATLPAPKAFPALRKVTFQSPKKFITYDIESKPCKLITPSNTNQMQTSVSSKGSDDSNESSSTTNSASSTASSTTNRRKSILSIFGLSRNNKESASSNQTSKSGSSTIPPPPILNQATTAAAQERRTSLPPKEERIISKCETADLTNIWTKEHKKAAFEMLAAMNAAEGGGMAPRHKIRQSVRERNTLQRNRMRRSLMVPTNVHHQAPIGMREQIVL